MISHSPQKFRNIQWPVCGKCGLVYFKNELTAIAIKSGCNQKSIDLRNLRKNR